jgi:hypothetical protein
MGEIPYLYIRRDSFMKFTKVEKVPEKNRGKKRLQVFFSEFMTANVKTARVDFAEGDYANVNVARTTLSTAAMRGAFPIRVCIRGDEIYLVRTDMD